jgi:hypothetical protein
MSHTMNSTIFTFHNNHIKTKQKNLQQQFLYDFVIRKHVQNSGVYKTKMITVNEIKSNSSIKYKLIIYV